MSECVKLRNNLIKECVCELRFIPNTDEILDIAPILIDLLKKNSFFADFALKKTQYKKYPFDDVPKNSIAKFEPTYRLKKDSYDIGIGSSSIVINKIGDYTSFNEFFSVVKKVLDTVDLNVKYLKEIRLRYVNMADEGLFDVVKLEISGINIDEKSPVTLQYVTGNESDGKVITLLGNNIEVNYKTKTETKTVIDIDSYVTLDVENVNLNGEFVYERIDILHSMVDKSFKGLLRNSYADSKLGGWVVECL